MPAANPTAATPINMARKAERGRLRSGVSRTSNRSGPVWAVEAGAVSTGAVIPWLYGAAGRAGKVEGEHRGSGAEMKRAEIEEVFRRFKRVLPKPRGE